MDGSVVQRRGYSGRESGHDRAVPQQEPQEQAEENDAQIPLLQSDLTRARGLFWLDPDFVGGPIYTALTASGRNNLPAVSDLHRCGRPGAGAFGVGPGPVPTDHLHPRMGGQPVGEGGCLAIGEHIDRLGADHFVCRFQWPGMPHREVLESMRLLAREVLPALRARLPL